jgi:hypothetical protein
MVELESISPTFYEGKCANFLAPIKSLTLTSSTKKLHPKLWYKIAACKIFVKSTLGVLATSSNPKNAFFSYLKKKKNFSETLKK